MGVVFDGRDPIYLQIADQIRSGILDGTMSEGEQVMSTTQYATTYRIDPATAAKAFAELVDQGVLLKRRGVGMFVAPGARAALQDAGRERFFAEVVDPLVDRARVLGIPLEDVRARIEARAAAASTGRTGGAR